MRSVRIGSGAGFAGDRLEPAVELAERAGLDDIVLECLAERTIALGQQRRLRDPEAGHDPRLRARFERLLPVAVANDVRVITNMGAANPQAAGRITRDLLAGLGARARVAVVTGDDVLARLDLDAPALEDGRPLRAHGEVVSANAYLGADALVPALGSGALVVVTGRVADPSLFLAPLAHRLGGDLTDPAFAAAGTLVGHLLECAGQLTGGYFADPGVKDVPGLASLGFPYADVRADGSAEYRKLPGTGGVLDRATVCEQLLYEITDPTGYRTPDVVLDLRGVHVHQVGPDRVRVDGAVGRARPDRLKVSVGYRAGHKVEAEISYSGPRADRRAALAADVLAARLAGVAVRPRIDVLGVAPPGSDEHAECRVRVAALADDADVLDTIGHEVEALYTNGPAGGGGVRVSTGEVIGVVSTLVPRETVTPDVTILEAGGARPAA
ncbi:acyclic terpene utilization AtuA family protein [Pseudonocardia sp. MH-G8]|uniref:acyclic terpene utilization AtuA family protein n=1 Tax=Pseudonocardia sp. MH-G8 TaxID=1854588 RepID=UPI000BA0432B|nr:acyclic terpene utilization AtuA family protein [Pseudonocardia sp. MH-G8]OZM78511.1 ABC transporter substrate-binding protein [Pseudonocardia sp. MH-G8]